jgi:hypothetical protein
MGCSRAGTSHAGTVRAVGVEARGGFPEAEAGAGKAATVAAADLDVSFFGAGSPREQPMIAMRAHGKTPMRDAVAKKSVMTKCGSSALEEHRLGDMIHRREPWRSQLGCRR